MFPRDFFENAELDMGVKNTAEFFAYQLPELCSWRVMDCEIISSTEVKILLRLNSSPGDDVNLKINFVDSLHDFATIIIERLQGINHSDTITLKYGSWTKARKDAIKFFI